VVSFAGLVFGPKAAEGQVVWQIQSLVGRQAANGIQAVLEGTRHTTYGIIATAIGLLTLLFGASGVLIELRDALNTIWETPPAQTIGFRPSCK
jgi:membrane protein